MVMKIAIDSKLSKEVGEVFRYAISTLAEIVPCDGISIMVKEGDNLVVRAYALADQSVNVEKKLGIWLRVGERVAGRVAKECKTILVEGDVGKDKRFTGVKKYQEIRLGLSTPIMKDGNCVGVANLKRLKISDVMSDAGLEMIEKFARNLALVL